MLRGTVVCAVLAGLCVIVSLRPASCQLSQEDAESIVVLHNRYRGRVVPSAANMTEVKWDEKLKIIAEGYAVKCVWEHNPDLEEMEMGENLFASNAPFNTNKAMEKWFLEYLDYDYNNNSCLEDKMCGHYTQMVWAKSQYLGCAFHRCDTMEGLALEKVNFLVCNYFPAGNYVAEKPYEEGEWCSMCPETLPQCDQNLCVPSDDVEEETKDSSSPGPELPSTHTATNDTELESASQFPHPTMTDTKETGTELMDREKVKEDQWNGEGQATDRETVRTSEQPQSNVGSVTTSLIAIIGLVALLMLEL